MKNILFFLTLLLCCEKSIENNIESETQSKVKNDTLELVITDDYLLKINKKNKQINSIDFFRPIKHELIDEKIYAQILYEKKNIIINLEIGENANYYEDIYLTKVEPIKIEKMVATSIIKTSEFLQKIECIEVINEPILSSYYRTLNSKEKKCTKINIDNNEQ
ncbi:hypothetical protein EG240_15225 [Paenimyroides tangerinum]|uniref:Uncharacterized protein n=1 Tax=Paenimyroides tangerinum TaxID=2488728 RepID=A0A3P3VY11_9FLAO|nr:hypothetical protein [Paenimyroides tangerinum]RRJ87374.1 hypothetical protein EG240_15225 [Paenimyroides tangerinum]